MSRGGATRRVLLVGGGGGLLGRALLPELADRFEVRSVHRHLVPLEATAGVEFVPGDVQTLRQWGPLLEDVDAVVNVTWYRYGNTTRFRRLYEGLHALLEESKARRIDRFIHVSVPAAPPNLEANLPYLRFKRKFDAELLASGLSVWIPRPTMMFAPGDRLLTVLLRLAHRYGRLPLFAGGHSHLSPVAASDVARAIAGSVDGTNVGPQDLGGPVRYEYRELTELLFRALGRPARYLSLGRRGSLAVAQLVQDLGSELIYAYEVEWLLADLLGLPPYDAFVAPPQRVERFIDHEARQLGGPGLADPPRSG